MSLVSIVATHEFVSLMGDGRGVHSEDINTIVSEELQKVYKINDKVIVGFAGSDAVREIVMKNIEIFDTQSAQKFAKALFDNIGKGKVNKYFFNIIGGVDDDDNIYFALFQTDSMKLVEIRPKMGEIHSFCNSTNYSKPQNPQSILKTLINDYCRSHKHFGIEACLDIQKRFNEKIVDIDKTVNHNTLSFQIYK